jgi:hypothetical protein
MQNTMRITAAMAATLLTLGLAAGCYTERRTTVRETATVQPAPRVVEERSTTIERAAPRPAATETTTIIRNRTERTNKDEEN